MIIYRVPPTSAVWQVNVFKRLDYSSMTLVPELSNFTENLPSWQHCRSKAHAKLALMKSPAQRRQIKNFTFLTLKIRILRQFCLGATAIVLQPSWQVQHNHRPSWQRTEFQTAQRAASSWEPSEAKIVAFGTII